MTNHHCPKCETIFFTRDHDDAYNPFSAPPDPTDPLTCPFCSAPLQPNEPRNGELQTKRTQMDG